MAEGPDPKPEHPPAAPLSPPGLYDPSAGGGPGPGRAEIIAAGLSLVWLLACAIFWLLQPPADTAPDRLTVVMSALAVVLPLAMFWVAAIAARAARVMREDSLRLQSALDAIRKTHISQNQGGVAEPSIARKLDEIAATTRKAEAALAVFSSSRQASATQTAPASAPSAAPAAPLEDDQPALALGTSAEDLAPPLAAEDFIRALHFPESAEDNVGFAALRRALADRPTAQLVQASQDVLTLMSQDGIYMDDLTPDAARTELWRAFAEGRRGRAISGLGGVHDRSALALVSGRMKQDPIFRDAAHHFLRVFDRVFASFADRAADPDLRAFAETRTARAFMLLGRVAGTFD